jgi:N-acetylornithine carbamoyltransferase
MKHFVSMLDWTREDLAALIDLAARAKRGAAADEMAVLQRRILTMVFFNASLRTRASFEAGMLRCGGSAIVMNVGSDTWALEYRDGAVMNGDAAEHIREAAPVLSRYTDLLAVRTFANLRDVAEDATEPVIRGFEKFATVPLINMESAVEHPCQGLADWLTLAEHIGARDGAKAPAGDLRGKRFVLTWAPHIKGLPLAVPHSAMLAAAAAGMDVTVAHPPGYDLNPRFVGHAQKWCEAAGAKFEMTTDQKFATRGADAVYVKSWGAPGLYGDAAAQTASFREHADWQVTEGHLGTKTRLMHCLPVRRNVVIADDALNDPRSIVVDQAENRLWAQVAVLATLMRARLQTTGH